MGSPLYFSEWLKLAASSADPSKQRAAEDKPPPESAPASGDPPPASAALDKPPAPSQTEEGVSGTPIWTGRIHTESNTKLQWERAYGTPGATSWGEWEKLHRTDHAVAVALGTLVAPLRDAELEVEPAPEADGGSESPEASEGKPESKPQEPAPEPQDAEAAPEEEQPKQLADDPGKPQDAPAPSDEEPGRPQFKKGAKPPPPGEEGADQPEPQSQNEVIAEFVKDNFTKWLEPRWPQLIEQLVTYGLGYGFSLHEIVWGQRPDKRVPGGQAFYIKKLAQRLPSSVKSDGWKEKDGELVEIHQAGVRTLPDGSQQWEQTIVLPADKVLLCTWNRSGNNYQGFSAFRPGWYIGQMRADLLRILAIGAQRESCGVPVAEVDKDVVLTDTQRDELQELLENSVYHESAGIQLPPGVKINWIFSPGANKGNVLQLWQALGTAIMELVQTQQTTLGNNDTGSRAVGSVHADAKEGFIKGVRAWIEGCLNGVGDQVYTGLVKKLVDVNFGPQDEYPTLKLVLSKMVSETESLRRWQMMQAIQTAKDAGVLTLTEDDEEYVRDLLGLPAVDPVKRQALKDQEAADKKAEMEAMAKGGGGAPPFTKKGPPVKELSERIDAFLKGSDGREG